MKFTWTVNISSRTKDSDILVWANNLADILTPSIKNQLESLVSNICTILVDISNSSWIPFYELKKVIQEHILFDNWTGIVTNHYSYLANEALLSIKDDVHSWYWIMIKSAPVVSKSTHIQLKNLSVEVNKELLVISQVTWIPISDIWNQFFSNLNSFEITKNNNTELVQDSFIWKIVSKIKKTLTFNPIIISNWTKWNSCSVNKPWPM